MATSNGNASVVRRKPLLRALKPVLIWLVLLGLFVAYRYHAKLVRETALVFDVTIEGRQAASSCSITLDGEPYKSGQQCKRGERVLLIAGPGAEPLMREVRVRYGVNHMGMMDLKRMRGGLQVRVEPAPVEIQIDGPSGREVIRGDRATLHSVLVGKYQVKAVFKDFQEERNVMVQHKETAELEFKANAGFMAISTDPVDAQYRLTSRSGSYRNRTGNTPATFLLPAGEYQLKAWRGDYVKNVPLRVLRGATNDARVRFEYGQVQIVTTPPGASVRMNRQQVGITPLVLKEVEPGEYQFRIELADHLTATRRDRIAGDDRLVIKTNLVSRQYASAMENARRRSGGFRPNYEMALASVEEALKVYPDDLPAKELKSQIEALIKEREERLAAQQETERARRLATVSRQVPQKSKRDLAEEAFHKATDSDKGAALFDVHEWAYASNLAGVRTAAQHTFRWLSASWKLQSESRVDSRTILFRGNHGSSSDPSHCVVLISEVAPGQVVVFSKFWEYHMPLGKLFSAFKGDGSSAYIPVHPDYYHKEDPAKAEARRKAYPASFKTTLERYLH